jgi:flagellar hook-associated protein 1 FlgK
MTGRNTGLLAGDSLGFSGKTTIALVNPDGTLANRIDVDFTLGTISLNGGATAPIGTTIGSFATALNGVLTGATLGTASFTNGKLAINATGGPGIVIQDNAATPASRGGRGFSQFFGMNDLITSDAPTFYETGLSAADAHGLGAGSFMFEIRDAQGRATGTKTIAVSGATIGDILSSLNNSATGLGLYAQFTLDSNGKIVQTPAPGADAYSVNLVGDNTQRGATGLTFSKIMGLGDSAKAGRADDIALNAQIVANPTKLAFAHADLAGAVTGARVLVSGDARGATALTAAFETTRAFGAAGGLSAMNISVGSFTSQMLGLAGSRAKRAEEAETSATDLNAEVAQRRSAVEGVNLDEELANLTLYQQAYNASARLIAAAQDMMDTLLAIAR